MSISRRLFIKSGTLAALVAGISFQPSLRALAQGQIAPVEDPLSNYTLATFQQYVNSVFTLRRAGLVEVVLEKVEDTLSPKISREGGRESFTLHFRGGSRELTQDTYLVEHPALGAFYLFLVPSGADQNGAQGYIAVINRLSYTGRQTAPAGNRKPLVRKPSTTTAAPVEVKPAQRPGDAPSSKPTRKGNKDY